ncbi:hypothetical protein AB4090_02305 [Acidithiobacillus sp. IBUN Pt1247-S3]
MLEEDVDTLAGRALARLFSSMVQVVQETAPVETPDAFRNRIHDMVVDIPMFLETSPDGPVSQICSDQTEGAYDRDAVALVVQRGLMDLTPAFEGSGESAGDAMRDWWHEYGDRDHTVAWLVQQTASILVADAIQERN